MGANNMFGPEWMEYFQRESPFSYYFLIILGILGKMIFYFLHIIILIVILVILITPLFLLHSGVETIKIKLIENKKHKKLRKEKEKHQDAHQAHQNLYLDQLNRDIKKKKKHK
jgi:predicted tellurium resistance membrane protein TerC